MRSVPQALLLPVRCPACGRPARELVPCPWCGERAPAAPRTRGDVARLAAGLALLVVAAVSAAATGTGANPAATAATTGLAAAVAGLLSGFVLVRAASSRHAGWGCVFSAWIASLLALAFRAFAVPHPIPGAARFAWLFPALAAACFALRVPAEAPNAPASGTPRERALRRHAPDLLAALFLAPFAAFFASCGPSLLSLAGLALVLGVWLARLARPAAPLLLSALCFSLLLPDPAFFAIGLAVSVFASCAARR